ncbi:solute carrier organic anion transporter family member 74D-like isoform X2 [Homarus americanus]|uniref:solute carrier organic anion transporter family member 74D-like isoform X2 n=1 Tax=Homarus americanus TaxID=6706 RepID=UPI001C48A8A3|nr:solute carrier organic anion transporter family member 74D-like isoform X2 [Homarus americanus]
MTEKGEANRVAPKEKSLSHKMTKEQKDQLEALFTEEDLKDTQCGLGPCKSKWLQWFATKEMYMLVYCLVGLTQGMFFTYSVSVLSTIEKRFKLTSKETGILLSGNDISQVLLAIFLGYYGTFGHRPRWLGVGALFTAASCFTAGLPHLIYGTGKDAIAAAEAVTIHKNVPFLSNLTNLKSKEELCLSKPEDTCQGGQGGAYVGPIILLFIAQFFVGIAISIFFSVGVTYLDDNVNKKTYPIYYTMTMLLRILGPVFGFFIGGRCLSIWIDLSKEPNIDKEDPRWLGAWWLGFVFIGFALVITSLPLFLFPRKLPATLRREGKRMLRQADKDKKEGRNRGVDYFVSLAKTKKEEAKPTLKNLLVALKRLFTNKIWTGNLFSATVSLLAVSGYWSFKPKYLENQFRKSAAEANYYTGMASLFVTVVGAIISGSVMRWLRPGPRLVTGYNIFITFFSCLGFVSLMFIGCPKLEVIGPMDGSVVPPCSADCGCSDKFTPVCAQDKITLFYSPCYAGCSQEDLTAKPIEYSSCRCIANSSTPFHYGNFSTPIPKHDWGTATRGYCPEPCNGFFYYFLVEIIIKTVTSTSRIGNSIVLLRAVSQEDKGLSLGTVTVFISLFAFIPAPIIMGAIIDSACIVWDKTCGHSGNCWLYDSDKFRKILHLVPSVLILISVLGDIVVFRYSHQLDLYGLKDDDVEMDKMPANTDESKPEESKPLNSGQDHDCKV